MNSQNGSTGYTAGGHFIHTVRFYFITEIQIHVRCIIVVIDTIATSHPPFFYKPLRLLFERDIISEIIPNTYSVPRIIVLKLKEITRN